MRYGVTSPSPTTAWCNASATSGGRLALPATRSRPCAAGAIGWRRRAKPCRAPRGGGRGSWRWAPWRSSRSRARSSGRCATARRVRPRRRRPPAPRWRCCRSRTSPKPGRWDRLARGLTEEVIADLAANSWIFVLADATTRQHAGETPQAVGKALGAHRVVTGTVQAEGDRVRVTAALADAATGRQLWAKQWDGPTGDLLAIQAAASRRRWSASSPAATAARSPAPTAPAARGAGTGSLRAYELFLRTAYKQELPSRSPECCRGLPETGGRSRPALRAGLGGPGQSSRACGRPAQPPRPSWTCSRKSAAPTSPGRSKPIPTTPER